MAMVTIQYAKKDVHCEYLKFGYSSRHLLLHIIFVSCNRHISLDKEHLEKRTQVLQVK